MEILFLGGLFAIEKEKEILLKTKGTVHYADNKFQSNIIDGLVDIKEINMKILSAPFVDTYPKGYSDLFVKKYSNIYKGNIECKYVSFCNLWGYRNISRKRSLIKEINKFANNKSKKKAILIYSPHTPFLQAAVHVKKIDPSIHVCMIVPDLPQYMNLYEKKSLIYNKLKEIDIEIFNYNLSYVDSFVLLTEYMKDILNVKNRPYIVVEGTVNIFNDIIKNSDSFKPEENIKTIVYTGTLNKKFGVANLVEAFHDIDDKSIVLKICGRGDCEKLVSEYASIDGRIHYLGQLSNEEAVKLQESATVLINPRQDNEDYTKYSFPSKNMEYLLTGKPVIAYKLKGIPDEYNNYLYYIEDNSIKALKDKIIEVLSLPTPERNVFGKNAKEFIINNKNNKKASFKIYSMIKNNLE